jgi:hypothetical protein
MYYHLDVERLIREGLRVAVPAGNSSHQEAAAAEYARLLTRYYVRDDEGLRLLLLGMYKKRPWCKGLTQKMLRTILWNEYEIAVSDVRLRRVLRMVREPVHTSNGVKVV